MIAGQGATQRLDPAEPGLRPTGHRHRDGAIERDDRRWTAAIPLVVQRLDLRPVGVRRARRRAVQRRDRRLERVRSPAAAERAGDELERFIDVRAIPTGPVLVLEQYDIATLVGTRVAPG